MTPAQQSALEALAGRPLTDEEIQLAKDRKDGTLAASLSEERKVIRSKFVGEAEITHALYPDIAGAAVFLDQLEQAGTAERKPDATAKEMVERALSRQAWSMVHRGELDVGTPQARAAIDMFVGPLLSKENAEKIKALALTYEPVSTSAVSAILNAED